MIKFKSEFFTIYRSYNYLLNNSERSLADNIVRILLIIPQILILPIELLDSFKIISKRKTW